MTFTVVEIMAVVVMAVVAMAVVMVVDMAVDSPTDDNGAGDPRTVVVDVSSLGNFYSVSVLTIDAATSPNKGPSGVGVTPAGRMTITLPGYGVAFLTLKP